MCEIDCIYRGEKTKEVCKGLEVWDCQIYGTCCQERTRRKASCITCRERLEDGDSEFSRKWIDPLALVSRDQKPTDVLRNLLADGAAFLACGGPSTNDFDLECLNHRGMWTMCVNNMGGHHRFRPQAFLCSDPPSKFHDSIWLDPGIMKFIPIPKMRGSRMFLRRKAPDGMFDKLEETTTSCPNVWGFKRRSWMLPNDSFFHHEEAPWGNHNAGVEKTGQPKNTNTMLLAIRMMRYLGCRKLFLIGVDFHMAPEQGYSFAQGRDQGASNSNNNNYRITNDWLCQLQEAKVFEKFGMEIYNCYERSGLRAFPYVPFELAVETVKGAVVDHPDLEGWYEKKNNRWEQ